jgi:hypothetical protein
MNRVKYVLRSLAFGLLIALQAFSAAAIAAPAQITRVEGRSVPHMYGGGPGNVILGMIYNAPTTFGVSLQDASVYDPIAYPKLCMDDGTCTTYPDPIQGVFHFNLPSYGVNRSATWVTQATFPNFFKVPVMVSDSNNGQYLKNVSLRGYAYNEGMFDSRTVSMIITLTGTRNFSFTADQWAGFQTPVYSMVLKNSAGTVVGQHVGYPGSIPNLTLGAGTYTLSLTSSISSDVVMAMWVNP